MINHELQNYDYSEGIEFIPLMPKVMEAKGVKTVGESLKSVKMFGKDALGNDQLKVVDVQAFMEEGEGE